MRIRVDVGVAYGSDVELVMRLLSEAMAAQPEVLSTPAPAVFFQDFAIRRCTSASRVGWTTLGPHGHPKSRAHGH